MSDDLLGQISLLKKKAEEQKTLLDQAKAKKAVVQAKIGELTDKLSDSLGTRDWSKARKALDRLEEAALAAVESLAEALDGIDLDFD